jgi:hypothetical protein
VAVAAEQLAQQPQPQALLRQVVAVVVQIVMKQVAVFTLLELSVQQVRVDQEWSF